MFISLLTPGESLFTPVESPVACHGMDIRFFIRLRRSQAGYTG